MDLSSISPSELLVILDLTRRMSEQRLVAPLLQYMVDESIKLVDAERGYLVLFGPDNTLHFRVTRDRAGHMIADAEDQISRSVLEQVRKTLVPLVLRDAINDEDFRQARSVRNLQLRSVMCVPLISYGAAIGAIYIENRSLRGRFKQESVIPLALFAHQAVIALDNAERNEQLEARVAERTADLHRALNEVQGANVRLEGLLNFARFLQHEVRGYAAGLEGLAPLLRAGFESHPQGERYQEWLGGLEETVAQMNDLTQRMLILTREGALPIQQQQAVALASLLEQVCTKARAFANRYDLPLELALVATPDIMVPGDPLYLELAFYTGLRNAIEVLAAQDTDDVQLQITVSAEPDWAYIRLSDNGPGFPAALLEAVTVARQNAGGFVIGWSSKSGGSGLGLALMERVAQLHGGSLAIGNRSDASGAWVEFTLPRLVPSGT